MKKLLGFGLGYDPSLTVVEMTEWAKKAEAKGFDLIFFSETLQTFRDAISTLTSFALNVKRPLLGCTQIARVRSPLVLAQTFATLDEISKGRIVLSIGACTRRHAEKHGLEYVNPPESLQEYITVFKKLLAQEKVSFEGKTIRMFDGGLGFTPIRRNIPVWVAATSMTGLQIAGSIADGVLLNATTSVEYCKNAVKIVRQAAEKVGRNPDSLTVAGLVVSAVDGDKRAVDYVRREVASKFSPLMVDFAVKPRLKIGEPYVSHELIEKLQQSYRLGGFEKLMMDIPEENIRGLTAVGSPSEVRERIEEYRRAGVQIPIVRPASRDIIKEVMDAVTG